MDRKAAWPTLRRLLCDRYGIDLPVTMPVQDVNLGPLGLGLAAEEQLYLVVDVEREFGGPLAASVWRVDQELTLFSWLEIIAELMEGQRCAMIEPVPLPTVRPRLGVRVPVPPFPQR